MLDRKTGRPGAVGDGAVQLRIVDFSQGLAGGTDQELAGMGLPGADTAGEGVQRGEAVDQSLPLEKLEGPVDRRRRRPAPTLPELFQQRVGADRLVAAPDQFQHLAPQRRQPQAALAAEPLRRRHGAVDTLGVATAGASQSVPDGHLFCLRPLAFCNNIT